jgi:hypothetical protein
MKTTQLFFSGLLGLASLFANGQVTQATNTVSSAASYVGTANNFDVLFKRAGVAAGVLAADRTAFGYSTGTHLHGVSIGDYAGQYSTTAGGGVYIGYMAGKGSSIAANSGSSNTMIGYLSGISNTTGAINTFIGAYSGYSNTTATYNTGVGTNSIISVTTGSANTGIGTSANGATTGHGNACLGAQTGENIGPGHANTYLGSAAGNTNDGSSNIFIGYAAGMEAAGNNNVIIGTNLGASYTGSDKLMIDNAAYTATPGVAPLIWGDFANDLLKFHGKVGIGGNGSTDFGSFPTMGGGGSVAGYKLFVKGGILTEELRVALVSTWADYVFNKDYKLRPLSEVEQFINENGHLPNVPSAAKIKEEGVELGGMSIIQQEKIEELTLYLIQQNKEIELLKAQVKALIDKK